MLLDELMPRFDVVERHGLLIRAEPEVIYAAIRRADLASGAVTRLLLSLRAVPAALLAVLRSPTAARSEWRERRARREVRLADLERAGFRVVAESVPRELVLGLLGRFWTPRGAICRDVDAGVFRAGPPAGYALAAWNFTIEPHGMGECLLQTETRVRCAPDARRKFLLYWFCVRPGSGLIRRSMLRAIRREAEPSGRLAVKP
jgi:hypothetical protein